MQVQATSTVNYTTATKDTTKTNKAETTLDVKFEISSLENKNPKEITYDEYKKLDKEDIEQLFPKESMPEENKKAIALHKKVNISDDEILNQVLFEKELEAKDSEAAKRTLGMVDFLDEHWAMINSFESLEKVDQYMQSNNIPFSKEIFVQMQGRFERSIDYSKDNSKMTTDELFEAFDNNKLGFEALIEFYNYTPDSKEYQDYQDYQDYQQKALIPTTIIELKKNAIENFESKVRSKSSSSAFLTLK